MFPARLLTAPPLFWSLMALPLGLGVGPQTDTDSSVPTTVEQALINHRCSATRTAGVLETDASQACMSAELLSLRTDFGRDLGRLSAPERKTIDSVCTKIRERRGRDAYVECLSDQLVSLHNRRRRTSPDPSAGATLPPPSVSAPSDTPPPLPPPALSRARSSSLLIGGGLATFFVAAAGVLVAMKARRARPKCRVCGVDVPGSGDLCPKCRHEAADALRRAAAERAEHERAQEEEQRQQKARQDEEVERARQEEEARLRQEQAHREEEARREEELRRQEEDARQRSEAGDSVPRQEAFNPYAVLGVAPDATQDDIRAAYHEAKLKYDASQVSHLGVDIQEHFKAKAQAVERAYQQLAI